MFELYNSEKRYKKWLNESKDINVSLKEIVMNTYPPADMTLQRLAATRRAKGFVAPAFDDYTTYELEQSSGLNHIMDEIEYALQPGEFCPPHTIASLVSSISDLKLKKTELIPHIRNKMLAILEDKDEKPDRPFDINTHIYGDKKGRTERYHVYRGFKDSKEFNSHVETLLSWETEKDQFRKSEKEVQKLEGDTKGEATEILELMTRIIAAGREAKTLQKEFAESIETVRSQYSKMSETFDQLEFLQENKYIKYDLLELEEKMVDAGLLEPDEATGRSPIEEKSLTDRMKRATEVFYDITKDYYPEMVPNTDRLFEKLYESEDKESISLKTKETQNALNLKYMGLILGKLAEMRESIRRDVPINDYFYKKCYPNEDLNDPMGKKTDREIEHMNKYYTRCWEEVTDTYNAMFPAIKEYMNKGRHPAHHLMLLNYGLTQGEVVDRDLMKSIQVKIVERLQKIPLFANDSDVIYCVEGLAQSVPYDNNIEEILSRISGRIDKIKFTSLDFNQKLRLAWGLCALEQFNSSILQNIIDEFNVVPFEDAQNELSYQEFQMLRDIYYAVTHVNKSNENTKLNNYGIKLLATASDEILKFYPEAKPKIDPFKEKVLNGLSKFTKLATFHFPFNIE